MSKLITFFTLPGQAAAALAHYQSVFPDLREGKRMTRPSDAPDAAPELLTVAFHLFGQEFVLLNDGPPVTPSLTISILVHCDDQAEIDRYWDGLLADGGEAHACGWLTDRFGITWQITPRGLMDWISDPDPERAARTMAAMMTMIKLDLNILRAAYEG